MSFTKIFDDQFETVPSYWLRRRESWFRFPPGINIYTNYRELFRMLAFIHVKFMYVNVPITRDISILKKKTENLKMTKTGII